MICLAISQQTKPYNLGFSEGFLYIAARLTAVLNEEVVYCQGLWVDNGAKY